MSISHINGPDFQTEVLDADVPVLVDFWAPWCGPCRLQEPVLEQLVEQRDDVRVVKVNVDDNPQLATRYQVRGIPSMMLFDGGEAIATRVGVTPFADLDRWLETEITTA